MSYIDAEQQAMTPIRPSLKVLLLRRLKILALLAGLLLVSAVGVYQLAPSWLVRGWMTWQVWQDQLQARSVKIDGIRWVYYEGGKGPTLILLHGFGGSAMDWLPTAKYLVGNFHLLIPDLPGYGQSSPVPVAEGGIHGEAQALAGFVQALRIKHFGLVGHSMGGAIAGVYAAHHPQQVFGLALLDSAGLPFKLNAFAKQVLAGKNPFAYTNRAEFQHLLDLVFLHPPKLPGRIEDVFINRNRSRHAFMLGVLQRLRKPANATVLVPLLPRLRMPVLGLWCRQDRVIPPDAMQALRQGLQQATQIDMTLLNDCGHMSMVEKPHETAQAITRFFILPSG